jgi:single-strand DNA-binding protein
MFHQTIVLGNVGKDSEMRYTPDGTPVTDFTVAVNEKWDGGERTTWYKITCWKRLAEVCAEYVRKGMQVMVIGTVKASAWSDQEGNPRASLDLNAREVKFLGGRAEPSADGMPAPAPPEQGEENLPF